MRIAIGMTALLLVSTTQTAQAQKARDFIRGFAKGYLEEVQRQNSSQNGLRPGETGSAPAPMSQGRTNQSNFTGNTFSSGNTQYRTETYYRDGKQYDRIVPMVQGRTNQGNFTGNTFSGGNTQYRTVPHVIPMGDGRSNHSNFTPSFGQPIYRNSQPIYSNSQPYTNSQPTHLPGGVTYPTPIYGSGTPVHNYPRTTIRSVSHEPPLAPITYSGLPISIRCPQGSSGTCNYELIGASGKSYPYSITGGHSQQLKESTAWKIRYRPRPGAAYKTYDLKGGHDYELHSTADNGWAFYKSR